jgi:hypothetical protein
VVVAIGIFIIVVAAITDGEDGPRAMRIHAPDVPVIAEIILRTLLELI